METLLFDVRPTDPLTFALIALVLLLVALWLAGFPRGGRRRSTH